MEPMALSQPKISRQVMFRNTMAKISLFAWTLTGRFPVRYIFSSNFTRKFEARTFRPQKPTPLFHVSYLRNAVHDRGKRPPDKTREIKLLTGK